MKDQDSGDWAFATLVTAIIGFVMFCIVTMVQAEKREQEYIQQQECKLVLKENTGQQVYCGKACWRPEVRRTYNCKSGTFATYE